MAFSRSSTKASQAATRRTVAGGCTWVMGVCLRVVISTATIVLIAVGVLVLRLNQGPIEVPMLGHLTAEQVNAASDTSRISVGNTVLMLGDGDAPTGIQFQDVRVETIDGEPLFAIPRMNTRVNTGDLLRGLVRPEKVRLVAPEAQFFRTADGRFRFGIGMGDGIALGDETPQPETDDSGADVSGADVNGAGATQAGLNAMAVIIDGFFGRSAAVPELERLEHIEIRGANLSYEDRMTGIAWRTNDADFEIFRTNEGLHADLKVAVIEQGVPGAAIRLRAQHTFDDGATRFDAAFGGLSARQISRQVPQLDWLAAISGDVEGRAAVMIAANGTVETLAGEIIAENGRVTNLGDGSQFDVARLVFRADPKAGRLHIDEFQVLASGLDADLTGFADYRTGADNAPVMLSSQLDIQRLHMRLPEVFSEPQFFDGGQITSRWHIAEQKIEVAGARLSRGDLSLQVDGRLVFDEDHLVTDLRASAANARIGDLVALWPIAAAVNARSWIAENIVDARIDNMAAQMRIGAGEPQLALDFQYSDLTARDLGNMTPIEGAVGRGHLSYHDLYLEMDEGHVSPSGGSRIELGGSRVAITELWGEVTPADIEVVARGATASVLRLIADLKIEEIGVDARAALAAVALPLKLGDGEVAQVRADALDLRADVTGMILSGATRVDGVPLEVTWTEDYGLTPSRRDIELSGRLKPELLARFGATDLPFQGTAPFDLDVRQIGGGDMAFVLEADLDPAEVALEPLGWTKAPGERADLKIEGTFGDRIRLSDLAFGSRDLTVEGAVDLTEAGDLISASLSRVEIGSWADVSAEIEPGDGGALDVKLAGALLDVSDRLDSDDDAAASEDETPSRAVNVALNLDQVRVSEAIVLANATGRLVQTATGAITGTLTANLGGRAPVWIAFEDTPGENGTLSITGEDAGAVLQAADLYHGAQGGRLVLDATLHEGKAPSVTGRVRLEDVIVRSSATFRDVLREGGLDDAEDEVTSDGLAFRKVWIPFSYDNDVITLTDAIATSSALGLKVNGTVDEGEGALDLYGVISPAYGLTGVLDEIPVLGTILSGGEGEGILAMTFSVSGPMRDPSFAVNPLSILTPGILRNVFEGRGRPVSDGFEERINREGR